MTAMDTTTASAFIVSRWKKEVLQARFASRVVTLRIYNKEEEIYSYGQTIHFPTILKPTVNNVGAGGTFAPSAPTYTDTTMTINKWKEASHDIPENVDALAGYYDLPAEITPSLGLALGEDLEALVFDEDVNLNNTAVGSANGGIDDSVIVAGIRVLDNLDIPADDRSLFLLPTAVEKLRLQNKFSTQSNTGGDPAVISGVFGGTKAPLVKERYVGSLYNIPCWWHTQLNANNNVLIHREAWAAGLQKNIKVKMASQVAAGKLADFIVAHHMFGIKTIRANHGVILKS